MKATTDDVRLFMVRAQLAEDNLDSIESAYAVDLGRKLARPLEADDSSYAQIEQRFRSEARKMAPHYEVFYSLERSIRQLVSDSLEDIAGENWWGSESVPEKIKTDCESRMRREVDTGFTVRSDDPLDYATFGELGEIIKKNWESVFAGLFRSPKAVERVMASLNTLRGPIAHCSPLAEDEVVRLRLAVRDWFRLMT